MEFRPILSTLSRHKTAAALIVLEIAIACAIICNAMFLIGGRITQISEVSGVADEELLRVQLTGIGDDPNPDATTRSDLAVLRALPGVKDATVLNQVPFGRSSWNSGVRIQKDQQRSSLNATVYMSEEGFMGTTGLTLVAGRAFEPGEYVDFSELRKPGVAGEVPVAIITRSMGEALFPGESPVGKSFYSWGENPTRIVGVVDHLVRPNAQGGPPAREHTMIFPLRPTYDVGGNYLVRTDPTRRAEVLAAAIKALRANPPQRIVREDRSMSLSDIRREYHQQSRSMAWLLGAVILALLVVTSLGIIGLASFWVEQRTRQIGVRRALGATRGQILRYFQVENFLLATTGIVLGMLLAFGINQLLMEKYELPRLPWYYLPIGAVVLWVLGQLAVLWPARRAAAVPPAIATRSA